MNKHKLKEIAKKYPNDRELGSIIRQEYDIININVEGSMKTINVDQEYPNDEELGKLIRNN